MGNELFDKLNDEQKEKFYRMIEGEEKNPEDMTEEEMDDGLQRLGDFFRSLVPKEQIIVMNPKKYAKALRSILNIKKMLDENNEDLKYTYEIMELFGCCFYFTAEADHDITCDIKKIIKDLEEVDSISISANLNEKAMISFSYEGLGRGYAIRKKSEKD